MNRVAIYTAIFGGYDNLKNQTECSDADLFCFTDDPTITSDQWEVKLVEGRFDHPRLSAKYFKMAPHKVLKHYRYTIWIDGGVRIINERSCDVLMASLDSTGLSLFRHPVRDTIAEEAEVCAALAKCEGQPVLEQVRHYLTKGFPDKEGLYAATVLVRDNSNRRIRRLNRRWMKEVLKWSSRDQLSLPYLLWLLSIRPGVIPYNLWDNDLFTFEEHNSDL